jgi:hypothetical protein
MRMAHHRPIEIAVLAVITLLPACTVNVKKNDKGEEQKVDIRTPVGGLHVSTDADGRDTGLPIYPGARMKEKGDNGDQKSANVNISTGLFGLKVIAAEYESDDTPDKLTSYYRDQLRHYGKVLECRSDRHGVEIPSSDSDSDELKCEGNHKGDTLELKTGTKQNQRIVVIEPQGRGTSFALVRLQMRGKDTI